MLKFLIDTVLNMKSPEYNTVTMYAWSLKCIVLFEYLGNRWLLYVNILRFIYNSTNYMTDGALHWEKAKGAVTLWNKTKQNKTKQKL